jgi:hypothetical protein
MQEISASEIVQRILAENPWWRDDHKINSFFRQMKRRAYFSLLMPLVKDRKTRRAVVLMGPRRVGKTVIIHHAIQALIDDGFPPNAIAYFSVDHPLYNGLSLEKLLEYSSEASGTNYKRDEVFVFFDEIQYLRNWEVHLKSVIDTYPNIRLVASGSAAAALRLKSQESGAGRFTDFLLPPLTFYEYIDLTDQTGMVEESSDGFKAGNIEELNGEFINYLNFGGYPEVISSPQIQSNLQRFIKSDIIDKVLLRDLPSLYGIGDIQELNYLFTTLAFNTANEISLQELAINSGVAKNTIKRYIEYLEAAFLIKIVYRVDHNAKRFRRANFFKVYLTNPTMRAALFAPMGADDDRVGYLAETAIFSQWFHSDTTLHYARWDKGTDKGEVDIVSLSNDTQKPDWAVEVKWSDRYCDKPADLGSLISFCQKNDVKNVLVTTRTKSLNCSYQGLKFEFIPASVYCYMLGYNIIHSKEERLTRARKAQVNNSR